MKSCTIWVFTVPGVPEQQFANWALQAVPAVVLWLQLKSSDVHC